MSRNRKENLHRTVAVEISASALRLVSVERREANRPPQVRVRQHVWRREAKSLHSPAGIEELVVGFRRLVTEEKLTGSRIRVTLSGDFCVTRVVNGAADKVRRELSALEDRGQRYLSLGPGAKAIAGSIRQIDARHQHALLTVANQKTLEALVHVAASVGVQFDLIEPASVSLCRLAGALGYDKTEPVMIVKIDERGVELGLSFQGQLLLDYRPGGRVNHNEVAQMLVTHLARLKRYCSRYFNFTQGSLSRVLLCGGDEHLPGALASFAGHDSLKAEVLNPALDPTQLRFVDAAPGSDMAAALGAGLIPPGPIEPTGPNLMEDILLQVRQPLYWDLAKLFWPVAAALFVGVAVGLVSFRERSICVGLETALADMQTSRTGLMEVRRKLGEIEAREVQLDAISGQVASPDWSEVVQLVARCLPPDAWLEQVTIDADGNVQISGTCLQESAVYELVNWLKGAPKLGDVVLAGTYPTRYQTGPATKFDLQCKLKNWVGVNDEKK